VDLLIDEITDAALLAIEQAAGEAAKAAVLSMAHREAVLLAQARRWQVEAENNLSLARNAEREGRKNVLLGVLFGVLGGFAAGAAGVWVAGR